MKIAELRAKSKEELKDMVLSLKKEQFNLRMQVATGSLDNKSRFKEVRRTIARAYTVISEAALNKDETKPAKAKKAAPKKAAATKPAAKAKKE